MEITDLLEDKVIENIKKDIEDSNGQGGFFWPMLTGSRVKLMIITCWPGEIRKWCLP